MSNSSSTRPAKHRSADGQGLRTLIVQSMCVRYVQASYARLLGRHLLFCDWAFGPLGLGVINKVSKNPCHDTPQGTRAGLESFQKSAGRR